ncbi:MAG: GAF domain-containing protein [Terriglobales bacterium]
MATISKTDKLSEVRKDADRLNAEAHTAHELMEGITALLNEQMLKYNWVGFYMLEPKANPPMLALGPYRGAMTPHTRIPLNQGICGAAASSGKTVVVDDVTKDSRYLACSLETKSEIVVPVFVYGAVAGELDIDSHFPAAFGAEDRTMIEYIAELVGKRLEKEQTASSSSRAGKS